LCKIITNNPYKLIKHHKIKDLSLLFIILLFDIGAYIYFGGSNFIIRLSGSKSEGEIIYKLKYLDNNDITTLLPTEMTIKFKHNNMHQKVVGWSNIFSLESIRNVKEGNCAALFKVLGKKYVAVINNLNQVIFGYDPYKGMLLQETNETKQIAGFNCKKVKVIFPEEPGKNFDIYYTNDIKIDKPNWANPFYNINGVLMEYQINMFGIRTKIVADSVAFIQVDDSEFEIPVDYQKISKEELEEEINKLL